ncbi:MAG: hypothetical protein K1X53_04575 [Candidatus Sumerlaeaceae bacterium]|nr:hypothetical protein [Candidatus Sumerlaeaceae bacterium]
MEKSLDRKLKEIHADPHGSRAFILADAKDADMAHGLAAPGKSPEQHSAEGRFRTLAEYRQLMRDVTRQGLVDIMLMSASSNELLTIEERLFDNSAVTPAARANDTTDIFVVRGGRYTGEPSRPFRTATIDHIQCGKADCDPAERALGADLGLYSMTFNNNLERDRETLEHYRDFRLEAERKGFRHFLEVFDPNVSGAVEPDQLGGFINDHIARTLAGVTNAGRPIFLKIAYHGPRHMEALARYAPDLVPGILGGAAGTTYDAFYQLWEARKYGARAALYGRKINNAEHQLAFVEFLRLLADGQIEPDDAVRAYHGTLQKMDIKPTRPLEKDLELTETSSGYAATSAATRRNVAVDGIREISVFDEELTDEQISRLSTLEKSDYHMRRRDRIFGKS